MRGLPVVLLLLAVPGVQACHESVPWLDWEGDDPCGDEPCAFDGTPLTITGVLSWNWHPVSDCPDPSPAGFSDQSIRIAKEPSRLTPDWLEFTIDPDDLLVTREQRADPAALSATGSPLAPVVERHEFPVTITIFMAREPSPAEALRVLENDGRVAAFLKFNHVAGQWQAWTVAGMSLNATDLAQRHAPALAAAPTQEMPSTTFLGVLLALALTLRVRRRA